MGHAVRIPAAMVGTAVAAIYDALGHSIGSLFGQGRGPVDDPRMTVADEYLSGEWMFSPTAGPGHASRQAGRDRDDPVDMASGRVPTGDTPGGDVTAQHGQAD
ncbi:hypothetical protein VTH06DRAFT_5060 [Thermothelomyces fergusii]